MKIKRNKEKYEKKLKRIDKKPRRFIDIKWILTITAIAYVLSIFFSFFTESVMPKVGAITGIIVLLVIVIVGVLFDVIGVAITACDIKPFNSMASKKVKGSKTALLLIKNAEKVSAFCNDVVGDVCGVISGSVAILISLVISNELNINVTFTTLITTSLVAALTIGGKAIGKSYAINKSDLIIFRTSKIISLFIKEKNGK